MLLLKRMFDESDESVIERWVENPYWQYFCGETYFQHEPPFDRTELIKFRKRIGDEGAEILLKMPKVGIVDRGYKGRKNIEGVKIITPGKLVKSASRYLIQKTRKQFRARAGIEPVISHLKSDHRIWRNFLLDEDGDKLNTILAATGFNLRKMLQRLEVEAIEIFVFILNRVALFKMRIKFAF